MKIEEQKIKVKEIAKGYQDKEEEGIVGYDGKLDIRPPYQREFVYNEKQRNAVVDSVVNGYPLNIMYWAVREDENFEIIDGQQRTLSLCKYINGDFSFNKKFFNNLLEEEKERILNYETMVYFCSGTPEEKLKWFEIVNIAGETLTKQELRNAVYSGEWVTNAKKHFSKNGCPAYEIGERYLKGKAIRQDYLETAIKWISDNDIEEYMAEHQHDTNANELWLYFNKVIEWVKTTFPTYRKEMKGVEWGELYKEFKDKKYNTKELEDEIKKLMMDEDVTKKKGIYPYVLTRDEKYLNIRVFSDSQKREAYERQNGLCVTCEKPFDIEEMEGDHILAWVKGGKTKGENCQMLCINCNRTKNKK